MKNSASSRVRRAVVGANGSLLSDANTKPISATEAVSLARTLGALADPVRIQLLSIVASKGEVCSCDLIRPLAKSQPTISHHTTILANAGILIGEKRGRWTWWRVAPESLDDVRRALGDARA
jgi:ArsR family transcriptional regulator